MAKKADGWQCARRAGWGGEVLVKTFGKGFEAIVNSMTDPPRWEWFVKHPPLAGRVGQDGVAADEARAKARAEEVMAVALELARRLKRGKIVGRKPRRIDPGDQIVIIPAHFVSVLPGRRIEIVPLAAQAAADAAPAVGTDDWSEFSARKTRLSLFHAELIVQLGQALDLETVEVCTRGAERHAKALLAKTRRSLPPVRRRRGKGTKAEGGRKKAEEGQGRRGKGQA